MKRLVYLWLPVNIVLAAWAFWQAMYLAPTEATMGDVQRIFYYHVPAGMIMDLFFFLSFAASVIYLLVRRAHPLRALTFDAIALANAEVGTLFCAVVLMTGPLWGRAVWGIWWTWDERLTSTLVLFLIYSSYILLRRFSAGGQTATLAAVLAIFGFLDVPIVYMSIRWWRTQHPSPVFGGGPNSGIDRSMYPPFLWNIVAWLSWGLMIMTARYLLVRRQQQLEQHRALHSLESAMHGFETSSESSPSRWRENSAQGRETSSRSVVSDPDRRSTP